MKGLHAYHCMYDQRYRCFSAKPKLLKVGACIIAGVYAGLLKGGYIGKYYYHNMCTKFIDHAHIYDRICMVVVVIWCALFGKEC